MVDEIQAHTAYIDELIAADAVIRGRLAASEADIGDLQADNATIKGTLTAQSARIDEIEAGSISTEYLEANYAKISALDAANANISTLQTNYANVSVELTAAKADITTLTSKEAAFETATAQNFTAVNANVSNLSADYASFKTETVGSLTAIEADIQSLDTEYAQIDFANIGDAAIERIFSDYGMIKNLMIEEGAVTGELNGVTINGDLINANTLKADRLIVRGDDGLYYRLNVDSLGQTKADSDEKYQNGLDGSVIVAKSITAGKISVADLYAFDATIGGFVIGEHSLHSTGKTGMSSSTPGVYMDDSGQLNIGDIDDYIRYEKVNDHDYKLEISAGSVKIKTSEKDLESEIADIKDEVNEAYDKADNAKTLIDNQSERLDGWTENIGSDLEEIKQSIQENSDSISDSNRAISDVRSSLNTAQEELDTMSGFIDIDSEKAILELGKKDSPFGVRITNSEIDFRIDRGNDETDVPAYIGIDESDSKSRLYVERATFEEEIAFGNFVWVKHVVDGKVNMGLIRRGGN